MQKITIGRDTDGVDDRCAVCSYPFDRLDRAYLVGGEIVCGRLCADWLTAHEWIEESGGG